MAFDRDVTIDFNADISGYSASMGQMIQQTSQYSAAADGMIGKIGKLNSVVLAGVKSMSAFTNTNKVATAQAAAYQQQLSKIETSAKVNEKSFKELEKTTKALAKDFPIGMKQAVQQVEALQEAGVTSNKEISSLAKTFTKLGAATGTFGPEIGQNMLQLNRTFENGTGSMEKYADSLTQVTHQYGANAGAVTSFAKSIAPVAATVGMNETSVIGLSTAFSKLGEDGYAAANTFNKVMLDMSKSIREGTPEAKIYAEVMGTTADSLKSSWESNPAEGFIDFVESIKKQGSGGIRSLEQLGLEGVRTQKTIMALANSGDMRNIVATAQASYGGGSTGEAAETAMGGVNDQMTMLNETMAQTVATAGKPFLGFLEKVLGVANSLSKALAGLVESDAIQSLAKVIGVAGAAWSAQKLFTGSALMGALGLSAGKGVARSGFVRDFREGAASGMSGADASRANQAGAYARAYLGAGDGGPGGIVGAGRSAWRGGRNLLNAGGNLGAAYVRSSASQILRSLDEETLKTTAGQNLQQSVKAIAGPTDGGFFKNRKVMQERMADVGKNFGVLANQAGGMSDLMRAEMQNIQAAGKFWGRAGGAAARGVGSGLGSLGSMATMGLATGTAGMVAGGVGLAAGVGYAYVRGQKKEEEAKERGGQDAYRMYNEFAEKAGIATKGLVSFGEALAESTAKIAGESQSREEAYTLTAKESMQATSPGYERAYSTRGDSFWDKVLPSDQNAGKEALRVRGMLGENASPEAINRVQMDLVNQFGQDFANNVMTNLSGLDKMSSQEIEAALSGAGDKSRTLGIFGSTESAEFKEMAEAERARRVNVEKSIYGDQGVAVREFAGAEAGLALGRQAGTGMDSEEKRNKAVTDTVSALNLSSEDSKKMTEAMQRTLLAEGAQPGGEQMSLPDIMRAAGLDEKASVYEQGLVSGGVAAGEGQYKNMTPEEVLKVSESEGEKSARASVKTMEKFGYETGTLATEMAGTAKTVRESGMSLEDWSKAVENGTETATDMEKAWADVKLHPGDAAAQSRLANLAADKAIKESTAKGGSSQDAKDIILTAMTTATGEEIPALQQALTINAQKQGLTDFGRNKMLVQQETIQRGKEAERLLLSPEGEGLTETVRAERQNEVAAGLAAQTSKQNQMRDWMVQDRRQREDYNKQVGRINQQFELQQQYAAEDYGKQRKYMIQDYHRSVLRAEEDFHTQRMRAQRDFDKQVKRQAEETAKNMFDPYQRIAPQMVTDVAVLQQSLLEQNQSVADQLKSVQKLSNMGLSKDAIDQLKLMDPTQGPQVQRMLADAMTDPTAINKLNALIKDRLKMGTELTTSDFNKQFQNMTEDFDQSMTDMGDDFDKNMKRGHQDFTRGLRRNGEAFATAQSRAAEAHATAMAQMAEDNETAHSRSLEDLTGMAAEFQMSYADIEKQFLQDLANLPSNLSPTTKKAITDVLQDEIDAIENVHETAYERGRAAEARARAAAQGGDSEEPEGEQGPRGTGNSPLGGKRSGVNEPWYSYSGGGFHGGADIGHRGGGAYSVVNGKVVFSGVAKGGEKQNPRGSYGRHVIISDGEHDFLYAHLSQRQVSLGQKVKTGDRIGTIGNTGNTRPLGSGHHLHFEVRPHGRGHGSAIDPNPWLAEGGIVTRHMRPHVGEAGPEAVIPLNNAGMRYLADAINKSVMGRYWNPLAAQSSRSAAHSSPVTNNIYTYDQRTQFTGSVEVKSQDPEDMARKLAARERRNRLARKTGSAA